MSGTRKLAAILVADVVGYSRLAGADADRTLSRLRAVQNDGYGADSGPSRGDPGRRAFRPLEISPIAGASADPALYVDLVTTPRI
jgi:hypothetical protein